MTMLMLKDENRQVKELAARMTPELMRAVMAMPSTPYKKECAAVMILDCCAKVMRDGDPESRRDAFDLHQCVSRWMWNEAADRSWQGYEVREVL